MYKLNVFYLSFIVMMFLSQKINAQVFFTAPEFIGRISNNSITINTETDSDLIYYFEYGEESGIYNNRLPETGSFSSLANEPFEKTLLNLTPNTRYYYRLVYSDDNGNNWIYRDEYTFHTQRYPDSEFVFTVISDSHQGTQSSTQSNNLYRRTLSNARNDEPDLHFDLGDTFIMTNIGIGDSSSTREEYLFHRENMGIMSHSTPIFLIIGNHEEEEGWNLDDAGEDIIESKPIMSTNARKRYFLNPVPNEFFSGNTNDSQQEISEDHLRENYFAYEWGDALFVGIDPYWNTLTKPYAGTAGGEANDEEIGDRWDWTLGEEQYLWFKETLETSSARWKFVFSHQVVGGISDYGRGGAEATTDYEWGAIQSGFEQWRPDWINNISIHQLMIANQVTIFFHGHDHVFAKEEIDNMIYQECPQPSDITYGVGFETYQNNETTTVHNNSGHIRVSVSPMGVNVDYVRSFLPSAGTNGEVAYSYSIENNMKTSEVVVKDAVNFEAYPNPFNPLINIKFNLMKEAETNLLIYNLKGQKVKTVKSGILKKGTHTVQWTGLDESNNQVASGIYLIKISTDGKDIALKKCLLLN